MDRIIFIDPVVKVLRSKTELRAIGAFDATKHSILRTVEGLSLDHRSESIIRDLY